MVKDLFHNFYVMNMLLLGMHWIFTVLKPQICVMNISYPDSGTVHCQFQWCQEEKCKLAQPEWWSLAMLLCITSINSQTHGDHFFIVCLSDCLSSCLSHFCATLLLQVTHTILENSCADGLYGENGIRDRQIICSRECPIKKWFYISTKGAIL